MKIIIIDEIKKETIDMFNRSTYNKKGLYIIDDGIAKSIVSVEGSKETGMVFSMPLNISYTIEDHIEVKHTQMDDLMKMLGVISDNQTDEFNGETAWQLQMEKKIDELLSKKESSGESMNARAIIEAIAVTQKPELIKEI